MRRRLGVAAGVVVLALAGCTSGGEPTPTSSGAPTSAAADETWTAEELAQALLGEGEAEELGEPVATTTGTIEHRGTHEVEIQVLGLETSDRVTTLRYLLRVTDGSSISAPGALWTGSGAGDDTRAIAVVDEDEKLQPYTAWTLLSSNGAPPMDLSCACSDFPFGLDEQAVPLSALFPPLSGDADEVVVEFPGAEPVEVPVTRS